MIHSLPKEIGHDILFRLPVKYLITCTSVCKTWRSMIKNPGFIRAHLNRAVYLIEKDDTHLLLLHSVSGSKSLPMRHKTVLEGPIEELFSVHYDNHAFDEHCKIEFPIPLKEKLRNEYYRVVGICNGLVCLADDLSFYVDNYIIWNPFIRKSITLPGPGVTYRTHGGYDATIGFGFDAMTNDYKVVRLVTLWDQPKTPTTVEVYSLATGSWGRHAYVTPLCRIDGAALQAFVNGALHWPAARLENDGYYYFILAFELGSESFRDILMPKRTKWNMALILRLSVSGDGKCLSLFSMKGCYEGAILDIWVMKEYCIKDSWTKLIALSLQGPETRLPRALCFRKSGEVLLMLEGARYDLVLSDDGMDIMDFHKTPSDELFSLDLVSKQFKNLGICGYQYYFVNSYEESLVLLDKTNAVSY